MSRGLCPWQKNRSRVGKPTAQRNLRFGLHVARLFCIPSMSQRPDHPMGQFPSPLTPVTRCLSWRHTGGSNLTARVSWLARGRGFGPKPCGFRRLRDTEEMPSISVACSNRFEESLGTPLFSLRL